MLKLYLFAFLAFVCQLLQAQPVLVKEISPKATNFVALGNLLLYTSNDSIFKSDGTASGTVFLKKGIVNASSAYATNNLAYFITYPGYEIWRSDGTVAGTFYLATSVGYEYPTIRGTLGNKVFFFRSDATYGKELYVSDGTVAGTQLLKDIYVGSNSSNAHVVGTIGSTLYFTAQSVGTNSVLQRELWKTDGTPAGTVMVKDINTNGSSFPLNGGISFESTSAHIFFTANDGLHGDQLWKSDGTSAGTVPITEFDYDSDNWPAGYYPVAPDVLFNLNGQIYFHGSYHYNSDSTYGLWKSDGTTAGTVLVDNIVLEQALEKFELNGKLIIGGTTGENTEVDYNLWSTDGTEAGTHWLKNNLPRNEMNYLDGFRKMGNSLAFMELLPNSIPTPYQLWKTDGSLSGTVLVKELISGPTSITAIRDTLFYVSNGAADEYGEGDGISDNALWQSDLTSGGTVIVKDSAGNIFPGAYNLVNVNGTLYFTTSTPIGYSSSPYLTTGKKLWKYVRPSVPVYNPPSGLILVDAATDTDIRELAVADTVYMNQQVTILAEVPSGTRSVRFFVNNVFSRNENIAPYTLNGDNNGNFSAWTKTPGLYKIVAVSYSGVNGTGTAGDSMISYVRVIYPNDTSSGIPFILVNAITDTDIRTLTDGETITMPVGNRITIRTEPAFVRSVVYILNGTVYQTENQAPFALEGDTNGDYRPWIPNTGSYTLIANVYSNVNGTGTLLQSDTIHFVIILTASKIAAVPNPADTYTIIETESPATYEANVVVVDNLGKVYYNQTVTIKAGQNSIPVNTSQLPSGVYILKITGGEEGERTIKIYK